MLRKVFLCFIPIFVAVDALGALPMFMALTYQFEPKEKRKILLDSLLTSYALCVGFIFLGKAIFAVLGISWGDFMVAGGIILFILAINDIISPEKIEKKPVTKDIGVVPIGTPLIAGPAVLTTLLILLDSYGTAAVIIAVTLNIAFVGVAFSMSDIILKLIGESGSKVLSKMASLFLAAIAVMMIRKGISNILTLLKNG